MTVLEAIQKSTAFLERKGVEQPRYQSEMLLAHVMGLARLQLYLRYADGVDAPAVERLRQLVVRRGNREPLQHLLGTVSFCGRELLTGPQALIPRPETELLAERASQWLRAFPGAAPRVLDFGTGSGCLAICAALACPAAQVAAVDISREALELARQNAARHGLGDRIRFCLSDGFTGLDEGSAFDLIVANPPYIPTGEIAELAPEVRDHDPRLALDGGPDGLRFYRLLAAEARQRLHPGGCLLMEIGAGQARAVAGLFAEKNWVVEAVEQDYSGIERIIKVQPSTDRA